MVRSRFSEEQIVGILKEHQAVNQFEMVPVSRQCFHEPRRNPERSVLWAGCIYISRFVMSNFTSLTAGWHVKAPTNSSKISEASWSAPTEVVHLLG